MACMEHACLNKKCEHWWANNKRESECPKCGSTEVTNWFDEEMDAEWDEYGEEYEDE